MGMDVDERGHDDAALGVHPLGLGIGFFQLDAGPHSLDIPPVHQHSPVGEIGTLRVPGDHFSVGDENHDSLLHKCGFEKTARAKHKV